MMREKQYESNIWYSITKRCSSKTDHDRIALDSSGVARPALSVRWDHEAGDAN
jgi:hypothetical protein